MRAERMEAGLLSEGVIIENLSEEQVAELESIGDYTTAEMEGTSEDSSGVVRYEVADDKVTFTVSATLPENEGTNYQVWLKEVDSETTRHAFDLQMKKGGYVGSAALSADLLPLEVVVRDEATLLDSESEVLLHTILAAPEATE